ncbi:uncharacterized protein LOC142050930 [Phalacrocorax aristotelis]|uniref:uncharacterized protein LOC142050930 n=1 Tax=Phalacrocorax aristotelis TaxID=126867 RepID=UPI003F4C9C64
MAGVSPSVGNPLLVRRHIHPTHPGEAEVTPGAGSCSRHRAAPEELLCSEEEKAERGSATALGLVKGTRGRGGEQRGGGFLQEARTPLASHLLQLLTWSKGGTKMADDRFLRPHLCPTIKKLKSSEFAKIWASSSWYLSQQLALHQAVRIPGLGTFVVVRQRVASKEKGLVVVERPVFHLANTLARDHDLRYGCVDIPGHQHFEQLPYARIASDNAVSEGTVQLCMERTIFLLHACLEKSKNVALIWSDVGMLIIEGKDMSEALEFLLWSSWLGCRGKPRGVLSSARCFLPLSRYKLETVPKTPTAKVELSAPVKATPEQGWGKGEGTGKKEALAEKRLLHRARLSPQRLPAVTVKSEQSHKTERSEPRARQLPPIQGSSLKEIEAKEKVIPLVQPRTVDFIARTIESREKNNHLQSKERLPKHIRKFLGEEEKKKKELAKAKTSRGQTPPATELKAKRQKETPEAKAEREKETQRSQESSSSDELSASDLTSTETEESSLDLLEMMTMQEWEGDSEGPPTVHEDDTVPPKRSLSPRTHRSLQEVVTCILGQVERKRSGQWDEEVDLQDKLKCELAVLRWHRSRKEERSSQQLREAGLQPAPPARPGKRRARPAQSRVCTEEERCKLWDSLRKKYQQKARAKSGTQEALARRARPVEAQASCICGTAEWWGEGREEPSVDPEESPEHKWRLCLWESSALKSSGEADAVHVGIVPGELLGHRIFRERGPARASSSMTSTSAGQPGR